MKTEPIQILTPFVTFITAIFGGGVLGAITNSINGQVSSLYFQNIMRWDHVENIPRAAIAQGVFEGLVCGLIFGTIFVASISRISKLRASISYSLSFLGLFFATAIVAWVIGGCLAMLLALLSPDFYKQAFIGVPDDFPSMLRYAWVGGSIWGVQFGGFALLIIWIAVFWSKWKQKEQSVVKTST